MGEDRESVFMVGCPSIDIVTRVKLFVNGILKRYGGVGADIDPEEPYLMVLQHSVTTEYGSGLEQIRETIEAIKTLKIQTIWLWPNVDAGSDEISKGLRMFRENEKRDYLAFYKNFMVEDYVRLINNCAVLVGNSSSGIREGAYLGVPVVNIGNRQNNRERGPNVVDVDYSSKAILAAIENQLSNGRYPRCAIYGDGTAGEKIADILATFDFKIQKQLHL